MRNLMRPSPVVFQQFQHVQLDVNLALHSYSSLLGSLMLITTRRLLEPFNIDGLLSLTSTSSMLSRSCDDRKRLDSRKRTRDRRGRRETGAVSGIEMISTALSHPTCKRSICKYAGRVLQNLRLTDLECVCV